MNTVLLRVLAVVLSGVSPEPLEEKVVPFNAMPAECAAVYDVGDRDPDRCGDPGVYLLRGIFVLHWNGPERNVFGQADRSLPKCDGYPRLGA